MLIELRKRAMNSMERTAEYVDSINTPGAGDRWLDKIKERIILLANSKAKFALCKHPSLAKFNYRCYAYKDWVIAFRVSEKKFEVCRFIWGKRLG